MIDPKELRIGNWVLFKKDINDVGELKKVFAINPDGVSLKEGKGNPCDKHLIYPEPLTEDILLNNPEIFQIYPSVFINAGELPLSEVSYFVDKLKLTKTGYNSWEVKFESNGFTIVEYVHQLQNLHFALTGAELEVSL